VSFVHLALWVFFGNFNVTCHVLESSGGNPLGSLGIAHFADFVARSSLQDLEIYNKRFGFDCICLKIDQVLVNDSWLAHFEHSHASFFPPWYL